MSHETHIFHLYADDPKDAAGNVLLETDYKVEVMYVIDREGNKTNLDEDGLTQREPDQYTFENINEMVHGDVLNDNWEREEYCLVFEKLKLNQYVTQREWGIVKRFAKFEEDREEARLFDINKWSEYRSNEWDLGRFGVTNLGTNSALMEPVAQIEYLVVVDVYC